ncbi:MAG: hypothetical protein WDO69_23850 [Pseudomonadota bacterium]
MDRSVMEQQITEYAERHDLTAEELRSLVVDITGSGPHEVDDLLPRLTPSELELVHDVVTSHNSFSARRRAS